MKLHINSQMYTQITPDFVSLISTETDQVILHIPSYTMRRLNELMLVQQEQYNNRQKALQSILQVNSIKDME